MSDFTYVQKLPGRGFVIKKSERVPKGIPFETIKHSLFYKVYMLTFKIIYLQRLTIKENLFSLHIQPYALVSLLATFRDH